MKRSWHICSALCYPAVTILSNANHSLAGELPAPLLLVGAGQGLSSSLFNPQSLVAEARRNFDGPIRVASDLYQISVGAG